jgi:O-antigen ligase
LVEVTESIDQERALSLQSRISHEITLIDKALRRPFFGWGGWNRNRADNLAKGAMGNRSVTDSFWIIVFGQRGLVGLLSVGLVLLRPIALLARRLPVSGWSHHENAPAVALAMVLLGFTIDCLVNAMVSPIYFLIAGSLIAYRPAESRSTTYDRGR